MLTSAESQVEPMRYPILNGGTRRGADGDGPAHAPGAGELELARAERERELARQMEAARREALETGRQAGAGETAAWRAERAAQLTLALREFRAQRDEYLSRVEQEVVRLALAIAERILHREAQMDALLLAGAVRVALGQLADSTEVRLRVPAEQRGLWSEMVRLMPGLPLRPEVVADEKLGEAEAVLEAGLGTVDLGVRAQIAEIERGFFDLLDARREPKSGEAAERQN
jgi:flagellar assembly protein FliH